MSEILAVIMCLGIGIALVLLGKNSIKEVPIFAIGIIFIGIGLLVGYEKIYGANEITTLMLTWLICGSFGGSIVYAGAYGIYEKIFLCTNEIKATFVEIRTERRRRGHRVYYPVFTYYFKKRKYKSSSSEFFHSEKRLKRKYEMGKEYLVYVSGKNPRIVVLNRKNLVGEIFIILFGLMILAVAVIGTLKGFLF